MPKSAIQQERQRLNKLRRQHPDDVAIDSRVTIIRKLLSRAEREPNDGDVRMVLMRQVFELDEYLKTERAKVVALR